jgi:hypothetical protein
MTEEQKIEANAKQKSLELLFDYTKFHIGLYITLSASYIAVATAKISEKPILTLNRYFFWPAIFAFALAGLAGGVIASSITQTDARSSSDFMKLDIGPWDWTKIHFEARKWTWIEHTSFWIGLALAVLSLTTKG